MTEPRVAAVVIGRNEGARLAACLAALSRRVGALIYVDSGSTDGSVATARAAGAQVVELDHARPFTAARARNAGAAALPEGPDLIQFVDGDCILDPGWIPAARTALDAAPGATAVCGRLRERHPEASVYNRLCDIEWGGPTGPVGACGGIFMIRRAAFQAAGGFRQDLIAGEEPELCLRLRAAGGEIRRIDAEMALHDAAMTRFGQWWRRMRRGGHAFAEGAALHGTGPERHCMRETRRALAWGAALPAAAILGGIATPWALALLLAYPAQVARLALRSDLPGGRAWLWAGFVTLAKIPEALGVLDYRFRGMRRKETP